ncbi:hypothetical protein ANN_19624 [Periplaneta americana]|uniref:Secreted protein n=1 Tax=Periplaneta americana TaxID=6978 RepID=A0ABQ8SBI4_PERAM|nr:hypothetical protein ANN_19624 [Periplaneta americana]
MYHRTVRRKRKITYCSTYLANSVLVIIDAIISVAVNDDIFSYIYTTHATRALQGRDLSGEYSPHNIPRITHFMDKQTRLHSPRYLRRFCNCFAS